MNVDEKPQAALEDIAMNGTKPLRVHERPLEERLGRIEPSARFHLGADSAGTPSETNGAAGAADVCQIVGKREDEVAPRFHDAQHLVKVPARPDDVFDCEETYNPISASTLDR